MTRHDEPDTGLSRRSVLTVAAGAGAAGIAATAFGRAAISAAPHSDREDHALAAGETVVVHVRDIATGELDVFRGTAQTRLRDRALAQRIVRASR